MKKYKPTLFSILSIIGIILGIPLGLYNLTLSGGASLGGILILGAVMILAGILGIDRALVSKIDPIKLSMIEFIAAVIFFIVYSF